MIFYFHMTMCLEKSCFPDYWEVTSVIPVSENVGEKCTAKSYCPVNLLYVVSKVVEKLVIIINQPIDRFEKCGLFSDFQYGFMFSRSAADLLKVASDRIFGTFNKCDTILAVALDISKASKKVCHAGLLYKGKCGGISGQLFGLMASSSS